MQAFNKRFTPQSSARSIVDATLSSHYPLYPAARLTNENVFYIYAIWKMRSLIGSTDELSKGESFSSEPSIMLAQRQAIRQPTLHSFSLARELVTRNTCAAGIGKVIWRISASAYMLPDLVFAAYFDVNLSVLPPRPQIWGNPLRRTLTSTVLIACAWIRHARRRGSYGWRGSRMCGRKSPVEETR